MIGMNSTYEVALTSVTGNADLVISLNYTNKFPNKEINDYISEGSFATDSVLITPEMIKEYQNSKGAFMGIVYIGVYTNYQNPSTYTILITKKEEFNPIMLTNGQSQAGKVLAGEEKFYYFKTSSEAPVYATLSPKQGNPDLEVSIIKNLSESKYYWKKYSETPFKTSELVFGSDQIYLSPNHTDFKKSCGSSCILLLRVINKEHKSGESNYLLTVTRDILELTENT